MEDVGGVEMGEVACSTVGTALLFVLIVDGRCDTRRPRVKCFGSGTVGLELSRCGSDRRGGGASEPLLSLLA